MESPKRSPASADNSSQYNMVDVGQKVATLRRAWAQGRFRAAPATLKQIRDKTLPKGDALALAEVAGILGAKKTAEILPLCHPLPLDAVRVWCEIEPESILVHCEASTTSKTGVEMEALNGVSAALLCIYDLTKMIDPVLSITDIRLNTKEGGKTGQWHHPDLKDHTRSDPNKSQTRKCSDLRVAVLTMSDRCSRGEAQDSSGPYLAQFFKNEGAEIVTQQIVSDDITQIQRTIQDVIERFSPDVIACTGGTGLGPRDQTPEAIRSLGGIEIPGFGELIRAKGAARAPHAWLSRGGAALLHKKLILMLPGSTKAVAQGIEDCSDLISHAVHIARGGAH